MVRFEFYDNKWTSYGRRTVRVSDVFYGLLMEYISIDLSERDIANISPELKKHIVSYYDATYYKPIEHLQIDCIKCIDIPTVSVKYMMR